MRRLERYFVQKHHNQKYLWYFCTYIYLTLYITLSPQNKKLMSLLRRTLVALSGLSSLCVALCCFSNLSCYGSPNDEGTGEHTPTLPQYRWMSYDEIVKGITLLTTQLSTYDDFSHLRNVCSPLWLQWQHAVSAHTDVWI